jgi:membrane protein implicated in regulation of membrane protease activity
MGYGLGIFLLALGLILALAVQDTINNVDLTLVGWILALAGVLMLVLTAVTMNRGRASRTVSTTTHADGSQTTTEQQARNDAPPAV